MQSIQYAMGVPLKLFHGQQDWSTVHQRNTEQRAHVQGDELVVVRVRHGHVWGHWGRVRHVPAQIQEVQTCLGDVKLTV